MGDLRLATGKNIAELELNANDLMKKGYDVHGIVQQVNENGKPVLIWPMRRYNTSSGPMTR